MKYLLIFTMNLVLSACAHSTFAADCTREEAIQAETDASTLPDWDSLHGAFIRFSHCDDGAISEGYSETVGRLLAYDWDNFGRLYALIQDDKKFEKFVLRHIDDTVPMEYLTKIVENAKQRCPAESQRLCELIYKAAK